MKVNRKIFAWLTIIILSVHYLGTSALFGLYSVDQPLFVELFCINKDKPQMHCNGSCMLTHLDEQKDRETNKPVTPDSVPVQVHFYVQDVDFSLNDSNTNVIHNNSYYPEFSNSQYLREIFHPPVLV